MKKRILTGWNFQRVLYLVLGTFVIIQSASDQQWMGVLFGAYFASMGIFAFGCAGGSCYGGACAYEPEKHLPYTTDTEFEEIKSK
ncbi:MAG TPA: hypothetical protein VET23_01695 [Chitinophagaceae bacterium]|nr:hypothetical protein [Chitinophagaceae bacterium]